MIMHRKLVLSLLLLTILATLAQAQETVPLIKPEDPAAEWDFGNGPEFPGASGGLSVDDTVKRDGRATLKLSGDFSKGGNYVQAGRPLKGDASVVSFWIKYPGAAQITLRLIDGTGQCHQFNLKLKETDDWQNVVLPIHQFFENRAKSAALPIVGRYESWGGKKDGKWHGPARDLYILIGPGKDRSQPRAAWFDDVKMVSTGGGAQPFAHDFEAGDLKDWTVKGDVSVEADNAFKGKHSLVLDRPKDKIEQPISAVGPAFTVSPGVWDVSLAAKADLDSPDSSFNGVATLELLNAEGKVARTVTMADLYRQRNWQPAKQRVEIGSDIMQARFAVVINKASGKFWVDELSASYAAPLTKKESNVRRLLFQTAALGNLLFPEDPRTVTVQVEAHRQLPEAQRQVTWVLQDYFGAEVAQPATVTLEPKGAKGQFQLYEGVIDLAPLNLKVGPYYELHASMAAGGEPFRNYTSLAILPEAVTRKYKPEEIPFTSRNWDNRFPEYIRLTDRLGIRIAGIWGGWSAEAPYKPHAPQIELAKQLGMGVLTGTPSSAIEKGGPGADKWTEEALRAGTQNWLKQFGDVRPLIICLGNEPHATDPVRVKKQADAYRYIYEEVKKFSPDIKVIATSVPATEEYFKQGYHNSCDMYDYHVYEAPINVGQGVKQYQAMSARYNAPKPVWSTEIGLNSQGMARLAVAADMRKKFAHFFAAGGENISWFGLLYPDPENRISEASTTAHNVFDCRWNRYAPKLDAISYYNLVNAICIKKFVEHKTYADGVHAFLFRDRDGACLQILWKDKGRADIAVPLAGVKAARSVRITGDTTDFAVQNDALTVSVSEEPLLLTYANGPEKLADKLAEPAVSIASLPASAIRGEGAEVRLARRGGGTLNPILPAGWKVTADGDWAGVNRLVVTAPEATSAREGQVVLQLRDGDAVTGELYARVPVAGKIGLRVVPEPGDDKGNAGVRLSATNNGAAMQVVTWKLELLGEQRMGDGRFKDQPQPASAYINGPADGTMTIKPGQTESVVVPLAGVDPHTIYRVKASLTDPTGRTMERERYVAGFTSAVRAKTPMKLDGLLDEADWARAQPSLINEQRQMLMLSKRDTDTWTGPEDLSAVAKYAWDDKYLYVGVAVTDDKFINPKSDGSLWAQDGLQFLIDPAREARDKPGKYDYSMGLGTKGPQAWCHLSADSGAPTGEAKDIVVAVQRGESGNATYELAIPWTRLAPFKPGVGTNLALTLALNEDDGLGRNGFMNWFGDVQGKSADHNGDIVLKE